MLIGKKVLDEEKVDQLIAAIKKKKELNEISKDFVKDYLFNFFKTEQKLFNKLVKDFNPKSAAYKQTIKSVRAKLRRAYGLFRTEDQAKKRKLFVEELLNTKKTSNTKRKKLLEAILMTHSSTKERLQFYSQLYEKLFKIVGKPKTIIDLGCGINPFSVYFMKLRKLNYYAYDISEEEINLLNSYFDLLHSEKPLFQGKAEILDIFHWVVLGKLKEADICFLFKMTDVLDQGRGHKASETVIKTVPAKFVVVSFPTLTMSGKRMNYPRRKWIELMCNRLGYKFQVLKFSNEIFYVIEK